MAYARKNQGDQTRYIGANFEEAKERLDEGFAFVGDTDQFVRDGGHLFRRGAISVCLCMEAKVLRRS